MRIVYYGGGWPTNIGNAFIDMGAMAILRQVWPGAEIIHLSEMPKWFLVAGGKPDNALEPAALVDCDVFAFGGMCLCKEFVDVNGDAVISAATHGARVLVLGGGGSIYDDAERIAVRQFLEHVKPWALVSRDRETFKTYGDLAERTYDGIDCGFFLRDAFIAPPLRQWSFVILNFDNHPEPGDFQSVHRIIRTHHACTKLSTSNMDIQHRDTMISDLPYDYLCLYANAEEVHTDRVHTCVASLAYGGYARLYDSTPRGGLFARVGCREITRDVAVLDMQALARKKAMLVDWIRTAVAGA